MSMTTMHIGNIEGLNPLILWQVKEYLFLLRMM